MQSLFDYVKIIAKFEDNKLQLNNSLNKIYANIQNDIVYISRLYNKADEFLAKKLIDQILIEKVTYYLKNIQKINLLLMLVYLFCSKIVPWFSQSRCGVRP